MYLFLSHVCDLIQSRGRDGVREFEDLLWGEYSDEMHHS